MQAFPYENLTAKANIPILQKTQHIVESCFLINLDRRKDRLTEWLAQLPQPWPFPAPERFAAIDGQRLATPPQWRAGIRGNTCECFCCFRSSCINGPVNIDSSVPKQGGCFLRELLLPWNQCHANLKAACA